MTIGKQATKQLESVVESRSGEVQAVTRQSIRIGTWNVQTLVNGRVREDTKINLVVCEARRLKIDVLGLQETKWFGREQYVVAEAVVLAAGRPIPVDNFMRGEGVTLVLRSRVRAAFECGGSQWRAVSSRILSCKLKWSCRESRQEDGSTWMHITVCYAPTFRSSRHDKDVFYGQLMQVVASVPASSPLLVLRDFNVLCAPGSLNRKLALPVIKPLLSRHESVGR